MNIPHSSIIGGGSGIMMMAGLTCILSPVASFLTGMLAMSPVPLAMIFPGLRI